VRSKGKRGGGILDILLNFLTFVFIVVGIIALPLGWERWSQDARNLREWWWR